MSEQLIYTTGYKKKRGKLYFIESDGDLCEGVMCGLIGRDKNGKPIYDSPNKGLELDIQRDKGYLYFIKEGKNKTCEIWRKKMNKS